LFSCRNPTAGGFNDVVNEDLQLLREYSAEGSETAFSELVGRYTALVYSTALRRLHGRNDLAADVSQKVFVDLARKASRIPSGTVLAGWLHRHTGYIASNTLRSETRRNDRERQAHHFTESTHSGTSLLERLGSELDTALDELNESDRDALVLRYLKQMDLKRVGAVLDLSEDAAQKRVSRATEKLRLIFSRRGHTVSLVVLGILLTEAGLGTAPHALAAGILAAVAAAGVTHAAAASMGLSAFFMKTSNLVLLAGLALVVATPLILQRHEIERLSAENKSLTTEAQRFHQERDKLSSSNERLRDGTEAARASRAELMRLRGELARARAELPQAKHAASNGPKATASTSAAETVDTQPGDGFKAGLRATIPAGGTLLTGGWITSSGHRAILLVKPSTEGRDINQEQVLVESRIYEGSEELLTRLGYSGFFLNGSELRHTTLSAEETIELIKSLEVDGELTTVSTPRVITAGGIAASIAFGNGNYRTLQFDMTPHVVSQGAVDLQLQVKCSPSVPAERDAATAPADSTVKTPKP
jgi:RNA polymerase sigma factor (sigma-70 family)